MRTIYKFAVYQDIFDLSLPRGAKVISVQIQRGAPEMWVLLDTDNEKEKRSFVTYPTGREIHIDLDLVPIGTFQMDSLVFHLFEIVQFSPH